MCVCTANACSPYEFECLDGQCINLAWRCDLDYDCEDQSDENVTLCCECLLVVVFFSVVVMSHCKLYICGSHTVGYRYVKINIRKDVSKTKKPAFQHWFWIP